jgi:hypothetical protein
MLATTLGIEFDPELDWDEREQIFKMSGKIVRTTNITQSAVGNKDGLWTTVFAAAVFINDDTISPEPEKSAGESKPSLQEQIVSETFESQVKSTQANDKPSVGSDRLSKAAFVQPRIISSTRKSPS